MEQNIEIQTIKWTLELCNQEKFKHPKQVVQQYNIFVLGC